MKNVKETKKLNNKGFSLVELIIVVAIMAVLIGVLAPQYLKYVEKSRESADLDNYQAMITAIQVYYTDPNHPVPTADTSLSFGTDGKYDSSASANELVKALEDSGVDVTKITMKSSLYKKATITFKYNSGNYTFTTDNTNLAPALGIATTTTSTPAS